MGGIPRHDNDALKFASSTVWRFYTREKSFRRTPKLPIGAARNPFFEDFMNPAEAPIAKTRSVISALFKIRRESLTAVLRSKENTTLTRRVMNSKRGIFSEADGFLYCGESQKQKWQETGRPRNNYRAFSEQIRTGAF